MPARILLVLISCALSIVTGLVIARGGAGVTAARQRPLIGLSMDTLKEERWQRDRDTFIAEAQKLGATVIVQ